jgi:hypothetical protein
LIDLKSEDSFRRVERGVARDDDIGNELPDLRRHQPARLDLLAATPHESSLREGPAIPQRDDLEPVRIIGLHREIALGRLKFGRENVPHPMAAPRQFAGELDLERMSGVVEDEDSHSACVSRRGNRPVVRAHAHRIPALDWKIAWSVPPRRGSPPAA